MAGESDIWDGNEWEGHVLHLLQAEHGAHNVQKVPAKHLGDCGLDFICLHEQLVYQCYAVQEPVDVAVRADKQKSKITTDIKKFCDPNGGAAAILKGQKIKRWILAVPLHDSKARSDDAVEENWRQTADALATAETRVAAFEHEVAVLTRLAQALEAARTSARDLYLAPVMDELRRCSDCCSTTYRSASTIGPSSRRPLFARAWKRMSTD